MTLRTLLAVVVIGMVVTACGSEPEATFRSADRSVDSTGIDLFNERVIGSNPGCVTCHALDEDFVLVGPSLAGLADRAGSRVPGMTASDYVREAIVAPDAHVVDGFEPGQMPGGWDELLTKEQIDSLVDLLLLP